jgi:hypothetical protein
MMCPRPADCQAAWKARYPAGGRELVRDIYPSPRRTDLEFIDPSLRCVVRRMGCRGRNIAEEGAIRLDLFGPVNPVDGVVGQV